MVKSTRERKAPASPMSTGKEVVGWAVSRIGQREPSWGGVGEGWSGVAGGWWGGRG